MKAFMFLNSVVLNGLNSNTGSGSGMVMTVPSSELLLAIVVKFVLPPFVPYGSGNLGNVEAKSEYKQCVHDCHDV